VAGKIAARTHTATRRGKLPIFTRNPKLSFGFRDVRLRRAWLAPEQRKPVPYGIQHASRYENILLVSMNFRMIFQCFSLIQAMNLSLEMTMREPIVSDGKPSLRASSYAPAQEIPSAAAPCGTDSISGGSS